MYKDMHFANKVSLQNIKKKNIIIYTSLTTVYYGILLFENILEFVLFHRICWKFPLHTFRKSRRTSDPEWGSHNRSKLHKFVITQ